MTDCARVRTEFTLQNHLPEIDATELTRNIVRDLTAPQKRISSLFFYDAAGSRLFREITRLPEYYPARTEKELLRRFAPRLAEAPRLNIVEIGSGDCSKISILLDAIPRDRWPDIRYTPIDISRDAIRESAKELQARFPGMRINAMVADFTRQLHCIPTGENRLFCFLGGTIGNLTPQHARKFFLDLGEILRSGDALLLGADMVKPVQILERAYNDSQGVTAAFNRNILKVINRLIAADFDPQAFDHLAFYNPEHRRIEMHLRATTAMRISSPAFRQQVTIAAAETIHTENSHKYNADDIERFASIAGLAIDSILTDENRWFSLILFLKK